MFFSALNESGVTKQHIVCNHRSFGGNLIGTLLQSKNYAILAANVAKVKLFCMRKMFVPGYSGWRVYVRELLEGTRMS